MRLLINFFSKIGVDAISRLLGLATLPFITRALGPEGYGVYSYLFVMITYFGFFIDFGYLNYGTNKICEKEDSSTVTGRIISLQVLTAILSYAVLMIAGYLMFEQTQFLRLLLFSLIFIPQIIAIRYYYLAANKLYYNSIADLIGQIVYAGLVFTLFAFDPTVTTLIVIALIQAFVTGLVLFVPYVRNHGIKPDLNPGRNLSTLKEAYKLGLSSKAEGITSSFIILMTGTLLSANAVGLYNASYKIYLVLLAVIQGLSYALMPSLLKNVKLSVNNRQAKISMIFYLFLLSGIALGAGTYFFSEFIISAMFGSEFSEAVSVLRWFSLTILFWPVLMFTGLMLLAQNQHGKLLALSLISMCASVVLSLILINAYGLTGSALVLPSVAVISSISGMIFLARGTGELSLSLGEIFSPSMLFRGIKEAMQR